MLVYSLIMRYLNKKYIAQILPKRPKDANKGTFGKVLVIAGSENFPGAAYLACAASYRVGAGIVTLVTDPEVKIIVSRKLPEVTFLKLKEVFSKKLLEYDVILIGPGLGQKMKSIEFVKQLLKRKLPITVIDGDGLNILSEVDGWWRKLETEYVLTPHPGEMSRLTGLSVDQIQTDRVNIVKKFAKSWNQMVVLKGANTVVASPDGKSAISPFANPALATAGTGDVLSGIVAGLLAQGLTLFNATCAGVYIHGLAGKMIRKKYGTAGAVASDLLPLIPKALLSIAKHRIS